MSEQYQDGTFGDAKPLSKKLQEILDMIPERQAKITDIHCGTLEEIEKARAAVMEEVAKAKGIPS